MHFRGIVIRCFAGYCMRNTPAASAIGLACLRQAAPDTPSRLRYALAGGGFAHTRSFFALRHECINAMRLTRTQFVNASQSD